jgi:hypothetical protein
MRSALRAEVGVDPKEFRSVKITFEQGWILLEDNYGEVTIYPAHYVTAVEAKPTSYDRGS